MSSTPAAGLRIAIKNLTCGTTLKDLSIEIGQGDVVLVESDSKVERSLLFAVIMRLVPFESGTVEIDGIALSDQKLFSLRRNVRLVSADLPLVHGTVEHNIRSASQQHLDAADLRRIANICGLRPSQDGLPHGLETGVVNGGKNLRAGVCARVALARAIAIARAPCVLMIDDPAFFTDPGARRALERVIASNQYTVLIAAPNGQRLAGVDRVWRLGD